MKFILILSMSFMPLALQVPDGMPDWIEKGGTRLLLAVFAWMAITGKIVWGPKAEERERAERENGSKWEKRFMDAFHYSREAQKLVERAATMTEKVVDRI